MTSVAPYLIAALNVLQTLEREVRAAAAPGSREEISADALQLRASELEAQIARLEVDARSAALEAQLKAAVPDPTADSSLTARANKVSRVSELTAKLAQAERDAKAYKSRLRKQDAETEELRGQAARIAELEAQLINAQGAQATHARETEELRRRAILAEASCDALREEIEREHEQRGGARATESELLAQVHALQRQLQSVSLERATFERKAEVCEAELVDALAKVYTLEARAGNASGMLHGGGGGGGPPQPLVTPLSVAEIERLEECLQAALDAAATPAAAHATWNAAAWLDSAGLCEVVGSALLRRLRGPPPGAHGSPRGEDRRDVWLERAFVAALGARGGKPLLKSLLLETPLVEDVCECIWRGARERANAERRYRREPLACMSLSRTRAWCLPDNLSVRACAVSARAGMDTIVDEDVNAARMAEVDPPPLGPGSGGARRALEGEYARSPRGRQTYSEHGSSRPADTRDFLRSL